MADRAMVEFIDRIPEGRPNVGTVYMRLGCAACPNAVNVQLNSPSMAFLERVHNIRPSKKVYAGHTSELMTLQECADGVCYGEEAIAAGQQLLGQERFIEEE